VARGDAADQTMHLVAASSLNDDVDVDAAAAAATAAVTLLCRVLIVGL